MNYILSNTAFEPLPKVLGLGLVPALGLTFFFHALMPPVMCAAFLLVALFPWLKRFTIYTGKWSDRPVWSMNRHRTNVLKVWRLYRNMPGCSRATMAAMLAAAVKQRNA
jgi:hypothetical protein